MPHLDLNGMGHNMAMNNVLAGAGAGGMGGAGGVGNMPLMPDANFAAAMAASGVTPERLQEMLINGHQATSGMEASQAAHFASMQALYAHHIMMMLQAASASMGHQLPEALMYQQLQQQGGGYGMMQQQGVLPPPCSTTCRGCPTWAACTGTCT